ncbi:hypothetical protein HY989_02060 [Candidatus Micrarchaeota archaeon]|nr:hypothetical protein [Candidatus Micrarchaeota archaeon]
MPLIAFSKDNLAGETIAKSLIGTYSFDPQPDLASEDGKYTWKNWKHGNIQLLELTTLHIFSDYLKDYPLFNKDDLLIFASTHKSDTNSPALTVHTCGNFINSNKMGGNPSEIAHASASALKIAYQFLSKNPLPNFPAFIEATHHGPTALKSPILFAEIGSTETEYANLEAGEIMARCLLEVCKEWKYKRKAFDADRVAIGFGGTHYCQKFTRLMLENNFEFPYIFSKYGMPEASAQTIKQALEKSVEPVEIALIEKKSMNAQTRDQLIASLKEVELNYELV